jgi:hypothetical protein
MQFLGNGAFESSNHLILFHLDIDFLIDGQISSFCPDQHEAKLLTRSTFNPNNATQTHSIFVKL